MPFGDGTGSRRLGARTGRGSGYCCSFGMHGSVNTMPGAAGFGFGRGGGFGSFGKGRGWRNCYSLTGLPGFRRAGCGYPYASFTAQEEAGLLRSQAELLRRQLEDIQDRIGILEKSGEREG